MVIVTKVKEEADGNGMLSSQSNLRPVHLLLHIYARAPREG